MEQFPKIARARLGAQPAGEHPEAEQLNAFAENVLGVNERESVLAHLVGCSTCREMVSLAVESRPEAAPLVKPAGGGFRWATFQWAAVAASVAVVMVAVLVVGPRQDRGPQPAVQAPIAQKQVAEPQVSTNPPATTSNETAGSLAAKADVNPKTRAAAKNKLAGIGSGTGAGVGSGGGIGGDVYRVNDDQKVASDELAKVQEKKEAGPVESAAKETPSRELGYNAPGFSDADGFHNRVPRSQPAPGELQGKVSQAPAPAAPAIDGERGRVESQAKAGSELSKDKRADSSAAVAASTSVGLSAAAPVTEGSRQNSRKAAFKKPSAPESGGMVAARFDGADLRMWRLHSGKVQSSDDGGKAWRDHIPGKDFRPTQVATIGEQVWAGGKAGALEVSRDNGQTWTQLSLTGDDIIPLGDVTAIKITNPQVVDVVLSSGDDWQTTDGGKSFRLLPQTP